MGYREGKMSYWQDAPMPREQLVLFTESLESRIPADHPVRLLDEILESMDWTAWEAEYDGARGQPPIHPSVMVKVILFGLIRGITSSRKLEYTVKHSIDFIWLTSGRQLHFTTINMFRTKHGTALAQLYRDLVKHAINLGVAKLSSVCIDGTRMLANANKYRTLTKAKAEKFLAELEAELESKLREMSENDEREVVLGDDPGDKLPQHLSDPQTREIALKQINEELPENAGPTETDSRPEATKGKSNVKPPSSKTNNDVSKGKKQDEKKKDSQGDLLFSPAAEVAEETGEIPKLIEDIEKLKSQLEKLEELESSRKSWVRDPLKNPAQLPITDNDARILPNKKGEGYSANYTPMIGTLTDTGLIVESTVVIGNVEQTELVPMLERVEENFGAGVDTVLADKAYSTGANIEGTEQMGINLISPMSEVECESNPAIREDLNEPVSEGDIKKLPINPQTKRFDKTAFVFNQEENAYYCPNGKPLVFIKDGKKHGKQTQEYSCAPDTCSQCPLVALCRLKPETKGGRTIHHDQHEASRRRHREKMNTAESKATYNKRQHPGEMPFGVIKNCFGLRQFKLRGEEKVKMEWNWYTAGFNLRRLMSLVTLSGKPKPAETRGE